MKVITRDWLKKRDACQSSLDEFMATFGERATVRQVVDHLHKINRPDWSAWLMGHNLRLTISMVDEGADIHADKDNALVWAATFGRFELVKYLIEQGLDVHSHNDEALIGAALNGHLRVVKYLREHGVDINAEYGAALRWAAFNDHLNVVRYLVNQGAGYISDAFKMAELRGRSRVTNFLRKKLEAS